MTVIQISVLFFIASLLVVITLYMWYLAATTSPRHELRRRLRRIAIDATERRFPSELRIEILQDMSPLDKLLFKSGFIKRLDILIDKAGIRTETKAFLLVIMVAAFTGFAFGILLRRGIAPALVLAALSAIMPILYLIHKKEKRINKFTEQFPDALDMVSRSIKAGHSFTMALQMVGNEMSDPIGGIFKTAHDEQMLGLSSREAVLNMADRIDSMDLRFFVMAINIHREIGGNLGEILERLAKTIRERITIRRQVRVYTAQARLSGYVLAVIPFAMAMFFYFSSPGYVEELFEVQIGRYAIAAAIIAQVLGFLVIRRIVNIRI